MFGIILATALIGQCGSCGDAPVYSGCGCGSASEYNAPVATSVKSSPDCTLCGCGDAPISYWTTAKVTTANCYVRVPVVNGCLPRIRYHQENGKIVSMNCDYSANIPYEGGCPTYVPVQKKTEGKMPPPKETPTAPAPIPAPPVRMPAPKDDVLKEGATTPISTRSVHPSHRVAG